MDEFDFDLDSFEIESTESTNEINELLNFDFSDEVPEEELLDLDEYFL